MVALREADIFDQAPQIPVFYADTGEPVLTAIPDFSTIDAFFDVVEAAYARHADRVDATYDPASGVPISIWIDASFQTADEEFGYSVRAFRPR